MKYQILKHIEVPALVVVPLALILCAAFQITQTALLTLATTILALGVFFARFEASRPALRQIMPAAVLGALAAAGRMLFAAVPNFKPVSAICIIAGIMFGRQAGFMTGALAALVSNLFLGQGPWTPWQMYAWGMIGYFAGVLSGRGIFEKRTLLYVFGFLSAIFYGLVLNSWYIIGFLQPITIESVLLAYIFALPFDVMHGVATVIFLLMLYAPWRKKLERVKKKYDINNKVQ